MSLYEYHSELKAERKLTSSVGNKKLTVLIKTHSLGTQNWRLQLWKDSLCMQYLLWGVNTEKSLETLLLAQSLRKLKNLSNFHNFAAHRSISTDI